MPATALESARSAAATYTDAVIARRRAYVELPVDGPDRADSDDTLERLRDATRRAFRKFVESLAELTATGDQAEALALILDVNARTSAARPPVEITISED